MTTRIRRKKPAASHKPGTPGQGANADDGIAVPPDHAGLRAGLLELRTHMLRTAGGLGHMLADIHPAQAAGASNLLHYLAFRASDVRAMQDGLHAIGLSSLASAESHIVAQLEQVLGWLGWKRTADQPSPPCDSASGQALLQAHADRLFGPRQGTAVNHVMVTLDEKTAGNLQLLCAAMERGMDIARINCAHDEADTWLRWIANVRTAAMQCGRSCRIYMDLPGPKMRLRLVAGASRKGRIRIAPGDRIQLLEPGDTPEPGSKAIACQEPGIVRQLKQGNKVLIDDGKYAGEIRRKGKQCWLRIDRVIGRKPRLENDKGINFPCTGLKIPIITHNDAQILPFIAAHADLVGCSFVRMREDVAILRDALSACPRRPDLILKIETPEAMLHLPELLLEAMSDRSCGVMIARGDLAVEMGFTQLSDLQDKILWLCEAAHVPVVWATQVLETLNKTGMATRSEITDAAHAFKAECVMLNKGSFLLETLDTLQDILHITDGHRRKKRYTLRPLQVAREFFRRHPLETGS